MDKNRRGTDPIEQADPWPRTAREMVLSNRNRPLQRLRHRVGVGGAQFHQHAPAQGLHRDPGLTGRVTTQRLRKRLGRVERRCRCFEHVLDASSTTDLDATYTLDNEGRMKLKSMVHLARFDRWIVAAN